jgi:fucose permease
MGLQDANANAFTTRLPSPSQKMSLLHAVYGLGAFVTPLVGTQFAREGMRGRWQGFYLCSVVVGGVQLNLT